MKKTNPSSVKVSNPVASGHNRQVQRASGAQPWPWRTLLGVGMILAELWFNTGIIWGLLMLLWAFMGVSSGQTYILEPLIKEEYPVLFWCVITLWFVIAGLLFVSNPYIYGLISSAMK